jgi:hypothetical protein
MILLSPPAPQCPDGLWREGDFRWFDVALKVTSDLLAGQRGINRKIVTQALPLLQLALVAHIDRDDDVWVGLVEQRDIPPEHRKQGATDGFEVLIGTPGEIKSWTNILMLPGTAHAWFASLQRVKDVLRDRAAKLGLRMPPRFTVETEDARAELHAWLTERQARAAV